MKEKWQSISPQDKKTLVIGSIILAVILAYYFIYRPITTGIQELKVQIADEQALITWMEPAAKHIQILRKNQSSIETTQESLLALIEQSLKTSELNKFANEVSQTERNKVLLKLDQAPFDTTTEWLTQLRKKQAIQVIQLSAKPTGSPGFVQLMVVLSKVEPS